MINTVISLLNLTPSTKVLYLLSSIHSSKAGAKATAIGKKVSINPMVLSFLPINVLLRTKSPMIDIIKLLIIKGNANKIIKSTSPIDPPKLQLVMISAVNAKMIEITPRTLEVLVVLGECSFF